MGSKKRILERWLICSFSACATFAENEPSAQLLQGSKEPELGEIRSPKIVTYRPLLEVTEPVSFDTEETFVSNSPWRCAQRREISFQGCSAEQLVQLYNTFFFEMHNSYAPQYKVSGIPDDVGQWVYASWSPYFPFRKNGHSSVLNGHTTPLIQNVLPAEIKENLPVSYAVLLQPSWTATLFLSHLIEAANNKCTSSLAYIDVEIDYPANEATRMTEDKDDVVCENAFASKTKFTLANSIPTTRDKNSIYISTTILELVTDIAAAVKDVCSSAAQP